MKTSRSSHPLSLAREAGVTLTEMLIAAAVGSLMMGVTMTAMRDAMRANESVMRMTNLNFGLRAAMDLMTRDFLQVGSGLPPSHAITTPWGAGSSLIRLPGPPGTAFTTVAGDRDMGAVIPGQGLGPVINNVATDVVTVLTADNTFTNIGTTAWTSTTLTVAAGPNIATGPDRINRGDLMMVTKGSLSTLVQVTNVNTASRVLTFAAGDSLNLNQTGAANGNLAALNAAAPPNVTGAEPPAGPGMNVRLSRIRMITYYIDNLTTPGRPRLMRRLNNGHETSFDNNLGTVVAFDVENLQVDYDVANRANVEFTAADIAGTGACSPDPCDPLLVRKITVRLTGRASAANDASSATFRNTLTSQVSLRGMAFLNEYQQPCLPGQPCNNP